MNASLLKVCGGTFLACLLLTGCPDNPLKKEPVAKGPEKNDACASSFLNAKGDIEMSGVVIPLGFKADAAAIKIGAAKYTAPQAQKLNDAAQRMEQARLNNCLVVTAPGFKDLPPEMRKDLLKDIIAVSMNMSGFANLIQTSSDPVKVVAEADKITNIADTLKGKAEEAQKKIAETEKKVVDVTPWTSDLETIRAESRKSIATISGEVKQVQESLISLKNKPQTVRIDIGKFGMGATSLPAAAREELRTSVQLALEKIPAPQRAVLVVVGYADKSGNYLRNVDLGLRRAQTVMTYLMHQRFSKDYEGRAASGGIDESAESRHVSIFVTGTEA